MTRAIKLQFANERKSNLLSFDVAFGNLDSDYITDGGRKTVRDVVRMQESLNAARVCNE